MLSSARKDIEPKVITDSVVNRVGDVLATLPPETLLRNLRPNSRVSLTAKFHPELYAESPESVPEPWTNYLNHLIDTNQRTGNAIKGDVSRTLLEAMRLGIINIESLKRVSLEGLRNLAEAKINLGDLNRGEITIAKIYMLGHPDTT